MSDQPDTLPAQCQASCEAPLAQGFYLCNAHGEQLVEELLDVMPRTVTEQDGSTREISGLAEDLLVTMTRQSRMATGDHGSRSAESPLPWNDRAACAELELKAILAAWCSETAQIKQDHDRDPLNAVHWADPGEMAGWLKRNVDTARQHDMAGTMFAEVCDAITEAKRVVDKPVSPSPFGLCGAEDPETGEACQEYLYAPRGREWIACKCGAKHSAKARWDWMMARCQNLNGSASRIASWLLMFGINTTTDAVRGMARRGKLRPIDPEAETPRFRLVDAVDVYSRSRSRAARQDAAA